MMQERAKQPKMEVRIDMASSCAENCDSHAIHRNCLIRQQVDQNRKLLRKDDGGVGGHDGGGAQPRGAREELVLHVALDKLAAGADETLKV